MKSLYTLILVLLAGTAYGQSNLPACQGSAVSSWSNCSGEETQSDQEKDWDSKYPQRCFINH